MTSSKLNNELRILNTECGRFSDIAIKEIEKLGVVTNIEADREYLLKNIADYDVIVIAIKNTIDRKILNLAKRLKVIVTPTTGLNHIDLNCANDKQVKILSLKGEVDFLRTISSTAEHTWGLLLCLQRKICLAHNHVLKGFWNRDLFYGNELRDKVLGIIGFGRLGQMIAEYGKAFGMKVIAYEQNEFRATSGVISVTLDQLLRESDVISMHIPLDETTTKFFDIKKFKKLKKQPFFVNTSRGEVIDESAMIFALENGLIKGAALDVLTDETSTTKDWLEQSLLWKFSQDNDNLLLTPHIAGVSEESVEKTNIFIIEKLKIFLNTVK
jgi:D-3-phosphoglycerate dehydrogenase / 2-oxoglutarate reductase